MAELPERTVERDQGAERPGWFLQKGRTLHAEIPWEGPEVTVCQREGFYAGEQGTRSRDTPQGLSPVGQPGTLLRRTLQATWPKPRADPATGAKCLACQPRSPAPSPNTARFLRTSATAAGGRVSTFLFVCLFFFFFFRYH